MKFIPDTEIKVHMGYDSRKPVEVKKAHLIAFYLVPHIKAKSREYEKMFDKFMEMDYRDLEEMFSGNIYKQAPFKL